MSRLITQSLRTLTRSASIARPALRTSIPINLTRNFQVYSKLNNSAKEILNKSLQEEIKSESTIENELPKDLSSWLESKGYELNNKPLDGTSTAELVKRNTDEVVHIRFDVNQIVNLPLSEAEEVEEFENEEYEDEANYASVNVIVVNKKNDTALNFDLFYKVEEPCFDIVSITPYESSQEALSIKSEDVEKSAYKYSGPPFSNLDADVQTNIEAYLNSIGVTEELAQFFLGYSEFKENNEYLNWLKTLENFTK